MRGEHVPPPHPCLGRLEQMARCHETDGQSRLERVIHGDRTIEVHTRKRRRCAEEEEDADSVARINRALLDGRMERRTHDFLHVALFKQLPCRGGEACPLPRARCFGYHDARDMRRQLVRQADEPGDRLYNGERDPFAVQHYCASGGSARRFVLTLDEPRVRLFDLFEYAHCEFGLGALFLGELLFSEFALDPRWLRRMLLLHVPTEHSHVRKNEKKKNRTNQTKNGKLGTPTGP